MIARQPGLAVLLLRRLQSKVVADCNNVAVTDDIVRVEFVPTPCLLLIPKVLVSENGSASYTIKLTDSPPESEKMMARMSN